MLIWMGKYSNRQEIAVSFAYFDILGFKNQFNPCIGTVSEEWQSG